MENPALDEPDGWSISLGRFLGVRVRLHALFLVVALGLILRAGFSNEGDPGIWIAALAVQILLLLSVFVHEIAHVVAARLVGGFPERMLLWPLGGLTRQEPGEECTPGARLLVSAAGPLANLMVCLVCALSLFAAGHRPPLDLFHDPLVPPIGLSTFAVFMDRLFWINWILFLFNAVIPALPLDAGEALLGLVAARLGERSGVLAAVKASLCSLLGCAVAAVALNDVLGLVLAIVIWTAARQRMLRMESGEGEFLGGVDGFGATTSLEMAPQPPVRSWWTRYRERVAAKRLEREAENRRLDEERMDGLLEKLHRLGRDGLTAEERRFMELFASRCRDRQSGTRG